MGEGDGAGDLVAGQVLAGEVDDLGFGQGLSRSRHYRGVDALSPLFVRDPEDGDVDDLRMVLECRLDLGGIESAPGS